MRRIIGGLLDYILRLRDIQILALPAIAILGGLVVIIELSVGGLVAWLSAGWG